MDSSTLCIWKNPFDSKLDKVDIILGHKFDQLVPLKGWKPFLSLLWCRICCKVYMVLSSLRAVFVCCCWYYSTILCATLRILLVFYVLHGFITRKTKRYRKKTELVWTLRCGSKKGVNLQFKKSTSLQWILVLSTTFLEAPMHYMMSSFFVVVLPYCTRLFQVFLLQL